MFLKEIIKNMVEKGKHLKVVWLKMIKQDRRRVCHLGTRQRREIVILVEQFQLLQLLLMLIQKMKQFLTVNTNQQN